MLLPISLQYGHEFVLSLHVMQIPLTYSLPSSSMILNFFPGSHPVPNCSASLLSLTTAYKVTSIEYAKKEKRTKRCVFREHKCYLMTMGVVFDSSVGGISILSRPFSNEADDSFMSSW